MLTRHSSTLACDLYRTHDWWRRAKVVASKITQRMFEVESCIRGIHVYKTVWKPRIGEILSCSHEGDNREDPFAVAVQKSSATVGHVLRRISCICSLFLWWDGMIVCTVTASKMGSVDLPQGVLKYLASWHRWWKRSPRESEEALNGNWKQST